MTVTDAGNLFVQAFLVIPKTGAAVKESVDIYDAVLGIICLRRSRVTCEVGRCEVVKYKVTYYEVWVNCLSETDCKLVSGG